MSWKAEQEPISACPEYGQWRVVSEDGEQIIAQLWYLEEETHIAHPHADDEDQAEANARLLAAAPAMYRLLNQIQGAGLLSPLRAAELNVEVNRVMIDIDNQAQVACFRDLTSAVDDPYFKYYVVDLAANVVWTYFPYADDTMLPVGVFDINDIDNAIKDFVPAPLISKEELYRTADRIPKLQFVIETGKDPLDVIGRQVPPKWF